MANETLNENGKLMCLLAAILVAGERANPTCFNPGNSYNFNPLGSLDAAHRIIQEAMQHPELRKPA
jgi:hypothetical protein